MIAVISSRIQRLHINDAGLLRLKKATRTASAAALSLLILGGIRYWTSLIESALPLMMGGLVTMQLMLLTMGQTRRIQQGSMLTAGAIILCELVFIHLANGHPMLLNGTLFVLAFFSFYLRRFGLHFVGIGLSSLFAYIILSFMIPPSARLLPYITAVNLAIVVAYLVNFYFLPDDPVEAYRDAIRKYAFCAAQTTETLAELLERKRKVNLNEEIILPLQQAYELADNQNKFLPISGNEELNEMQTLLNRLNGSFSMLIESMTEALTMQRPIAPSIQTTLVESLSLLRRILYAETIIPTTSQRDARELTDQLYQHVQQLRNELETCTDLLSERFFYLARITFCFRRLSATLHDWQKHRRNIPEPGS